MSVKIKPCPFCGLEGELMAWRDRDGELELIEHPNTDCFLADTRVDLSIYGCSLEMWNERYNGI